MEADSALTLRKRTQSVDIFFINRDVGSDDVFIRQNLLGALEMKRLIWFSLLLAISFSAGCSYDIVSTPRLRQLNYKCVYLASIESLDPQVGRVIGDVIQKELLRRKVQLCDPNTATIFITGAAFMTSRSAASHNFLGGSSVAGQAVESVTIVAKDRTGQLLLSASYDNKKQYTASKLGKELGSALAGKFK
jgi:hypothetical protein